MRLVQTCFIFLLVCSYFCVFATKVSANEQKFEITGQYSVHSQPQAFQSSTLPQKSGYEFNNISVQNNENSWFKRGEFERSSNENKLSTKFTQSNDEERKTEDSLLDQSDVSLSNTNKIRNTINDDFIPISNDESADGCNAVHNSRKRYSVSSAASLLAGMLGQGPNHLLSQFRCDDPHDSYIPYKAQRIYDQSITWKPRFLPWSKKATNAYVQCVTFVFMSYELAGTPITKVGRTNAADLLEPKYTGVTGQFEKFHSGEATQLPKDGDIVVWSKGVMGNAYGHTGIVLEVRDDSLLTNNPNNLDHNGAKKQKFGTILVANSNASKTVFEFRYRVDATTSIVTLEKMTPGWAKVPDFWLRLKSL